MVCTTYRQTIRARYRRASDIYYHHHTTSTATTAQHSTAQRSQPARQAANQVRAGQAQSTRATSSRSSTRWSGRDNPGKQTDLARASMSSSIQPAVLSNRTKKSKSAPSTKYCWCGVMRDRRVCLLGTLLQGFLSVLSISPIHAAFGGFLRTIHVELLALAKVAACM